MLMSFSRCLISFLFSKASKKSPAQAEFYQLMTKRDRLQQSQAGFSLVELSIVLVVIGLIIGGILKGQDLIESARLKSVLAQVNEYRVATTLFVERYDALPGDFPDAKSAFGPSAINGNGDGVIEGDGLEPGSEAVAFWSHLAAADLISQPGAPQGRVVGFNHGVPSTRLGGGITVESAPAGDMTGHWFVIGNRHHTRSTKGLFTPQQALHLDRKIDNGNPTQGRVRAKQGQDARANSCVTSRGKYNLSVKEPTCVLYIKL